jgi:hypothetical protein
MVTNPQSPISDRTQLRLIRSGRKRRRRPSNRLTGRVVSTLLALALLAAVLRYLPPERRSAPVQAAHPALPASPDELRLGSVQMSKPPAGKAVYLDGVVSNQGHGPITGAMLEVKFHDGHGKTAGSVRQPIAGMAPGGTEVVRNEFARNPIQPNEMRFFRVAVEQVPPSWNFEVPEVKIVAVTAQ